MVRGGEQTLVRGIGMITKRQQLEKMEMPASKTYNLTPDLKATPGKRGMMDKAYIAITKDGKWEAMAGWATMPNLQAWKEKHPEFYKK